MLLSNCCTLQGQICTCCKMASDVIAHWFLTCAVLLISLSLSFYLPLSGNSVSMKRKHLRLKCTAILVYNSSDDDQYCGYQSLLAHSGVSNSKYPL